MPVRDRKTCQIRGGRFGIVRAMETGRVFAGRSGAARSLRLHARDVESGREKPGATGVVMQSAIWQVSQHASDTSHPDAGSEGPLSILPPMSS